ncbi:UNVERIFIED_CONTAM: hypothetical protein FKN15_030532 [Acipenser sinensis]
MHFVSLDPGQSVHGFTIWDCDPGSQNPGRDLAYEVLSNEEKRREYDQFGQQAFERASEEGSDFAQPFFTFSFDDFFQDFEVDTDDMFWDSADANEEFQNHHFQEHGYDRHDFFDGDSFVFGTEFEESDMEPGQGNFKSSVQQAPAVTSLASMGVQQAPHSAPFSVKWFSTSCELQQSPTAPFYSLPLRSSKCNLLGYPPLTAGIQQAPAATSLAAMGVHSSASRLISRACSSSASALRSIIPFADTKCDDASGEG